MRIALVTDAWRPQTNGVVTTLTRSIDWLRRLGHATLCVTPEGFRTFPCPTYPEIRLSLFPRRRVARMLDDFEPEAVHIATEGPLGSAGRSWCRRERVPFTTSYHTQFPQYVRARAPIPESWSYAWLRRFHGAAARTMVATLHMQRDLEAHGFRNVVTWTRGVDTDLFRPRARDYLPGPRPVLMYVGRVAVEKNLETFLRLDVPGSKWVVGGGPALDSLRKRHPAVKFTGYKYGEELAAHIASADAFVFPSRTDTFGIVLLEAMACGVPVAAYPVFGPIPSSGLSRLRADRCREAGRQRLAGRRSGTCSRGGAQARPRGLPALRADVHLGSGHAPVSCEPRAARRRRAQVRGAWLNCEPRHPWRAQRLPDPID